MATKFKTQYAHDDSDKFKFACKTDSMTEQQFEYELNINNIVSGQSVSCLPAQTQQAIFGLKVTGDEFEKQLNATQEIMNYFEELPVKAKQFFEYKPSKLLDFVKDENNFEKAYEIGLINKDTYLDKKAAFKKLKANTEAATAVTSETEVNPNTSLTSD